MTTQGMDRANGVGMLQIGVYSWPPTRSYDLRQQPVGFANIEGGNAASYDFSVSRPAKYLWMTLDRSV